MRFITLLFTAILMTAGASAQDGQPSSSSTSASSSKDAPPLNLPVSVDRIREALERHLWQSMNSRALDKDAPVRPEFRALAAAPGGIDVDEFIRDGRVLIGTPDECVALAERARDEVGIDCINCTFSWGGINESAVERSMRLFATEVMPRARGATVPR